MTEIFFDVCKSIKLNGIMEENALFCGLIPLAFTIGDAFLECAALKLRNRDGSVAIFLF